MQRTNARRLIIVLGFALTGWGCNGGALEGQTPERLKKLPPGWSMTTSVTVPDQQLAGFSQKLGGQIVRLSNTLLAVDGQEIKVNLINCKTDDDAAKIHASLVRIHNDNRTLCPREGKTVVEFVCKEPKLVERAYQDLGFPPPRVTYSVSFRAAPVEKCDYMLWNKMFNACLAGEKNETQIRELSKSFTFGDQFRLRTHGLGAEQSSFTFDLKPRDEKLEAEGEVTALTFADLPRRYGLPDVGLAATVTSEAFALTPSRRKAGPELLNANEFWPSTDPEIVTLAGKITEGKKTAREKSAAILDWLVPGKNVRYAGDVTGSRYGVKKVLKQGYGHCWDFSDCYVTLCRASGVPSRQVLGWLHGVSGHVWAEVLIEGEGWRQVDPTAEMGCDCRYVPWVASEDGRMPMVYTSSVDVKVK